MAAFVLAMIVNNYRVGQEAVLQGQAISTCLVHVDHKQDYRLRQWCALCLGKVRSHPEPEVSHVVFIILCQHLVILFSRPPNPWLVVDRWELGIM